MRVVAVALLAVIIAAGGFWLTRGEGNSEADAPPPAAQEAPAADAPSGSEDAATADETPDSEQPRGEAEDGEAEAPVEQVTPVVLPDGFEALDYLSDSPKQSFDAPEEVLEDGLDYVAVLRTNRGDITVDLYEELTPETVNNFVFLALNRYYEGVPFHRVLEGFMAQTGDPTGTGRGGPGYTFEDEIDDSLSFDGPGVLGMANAGPGTNGSQFFITFGAAAWLDGAHTIFGHVTAGEEVLDAITRLDPETPNAVSLYQGSVAELAEQGIVLPGEPDDTVSDAIEALLGTLPVPGQSFNVAGVRGVSGQVGNDPAFGFFAAPDEIISVVVATKPQL